MAECVDGSCKPQNLTREEKRKRYQHHPSIAPETWRGLRDDLIRIGHQYHDHTADIPGIKEALHDAWDELIHATKAIPSGSSEHDRLVTLVLEMRALGTFERRKAGGAADGLEAAVMDNYSLLWADVPYLAHDLQKYWMEESRNLPAVERRNLATFTAKLCSSGIGAGPGCVEDLSSCALWLFKEALETDRPRVADSAQDDSNKATLPLADLLPACVEWLKYSNFKLARLSVDNYGPTVPTFLLLESQGSVSTGKLTLDDKFSLNRWLSWRQRLGELYVQGGETVSGPARKGFELMVSTGRAIGLDIPGEKRYLERLFKALEKELVARGSKDCVVPEDIEIDPAWVKEL
ncbi:hypothetical protein B0T10DRAFT_565756 [Thelonectria olida]|uniref:Uncharacterized protein n=1 Tax=Thelonectria olida TaxID=1576542 RepID=A0A9P8VVA5_9HYPO|nr:hypothetical protein B0T10DRAFT_565756 [Thelonectria olida]